MKPRLRKTKFYAVDLDTRLIRAMPYASEAASAREDNRLTLQGASLDRSPLYSTFTVADEQTWTAVQGKRQHSTKKSTAQLDREIAEALAGSGSRKRQLPSIPKVTIDSRERALIEEAAEAVYNRPGGEDLTKEEFREEVYGFLNFPFDLRATETLVDKLYAHFQSPRTRPFRDSAHAALKKPGPNATKNGNGNGSYYVTIGEGPEVSGWSDRHAQEHRFDKLVDARAFAIDASKAFPRRRAMVYRDEGGFDEQLGHYEHGKRLS